MVFRFDFTAPVGEQFGDWCEGREQNQVRIYDVRRDSAILGELNNPVTELYDLSRAECYLSVSARAGSWRGVDVGYNELTNGDSRNFNAAVDIARANPCVYGSSYAFPVAESCLVTRGNGRSDEKLILKDTRLFGHQLKVEASANIFKSVNHDLCRFQQSYPVVSQHFLRTELVGMNVVLPSQDHIDFILQRMELINEFLVDFEAQSRQRRVAFSEVFPDASEDLSTFRGQFSSILSNFREVSGLYERVRVLMSTICQTLGSFTLNRGRFSEFMQYSELSTPDSHPNFDRSLQEFRSPSRPQVVRTNRD